MVPRDAHGRKPRDGVERGVDRTHWAKLVSESPDRPARLATANKIMISRMFAEFEQRKKVLEQRDKDQRKQAYVELERSRQEADMDELRDKSMRQSGENLPGRLAKGKMDAASESKNKEEVKMSSVQVEEKV